MKFNRYWTPTLLLALALTGCKPDTTAIAPSGTKSADIPVVLASNTPLAYFAQRIGGDLVKASYPGPDDEDPAFWEPSDADVARLQAADRVLLNGATYEKWLDHVTLSKSKMVDTSQGFSDAYLESGHTESHSHGPEGDHSHAGTAFTTWTDFSLAARQANAIRDALAELFPANRGKLDGNLQALLADLETLDERMNVVAKRIGSQPLVASHPVYQYWAKRYKLEVQAVLWEPEVVPDDEQMEDLKKLLKNHPAKWMVWEGEPDPESVAKLSGIGLQSLVFDPCGGPAEQGDWLSVMQSNLATLESNFPDS
jgi:zinc transport system substrate-binding protein